MVDAAAVVFATWTPVWMLGFMAMAAAGIGLSGTWHVQAVRHAIAAVLAAIAVRMVNEPVTRRFARPRPFEELAVLPLVGHDRGGSFPSNHASGAFALAMAMAAVPVYGPILCLLAVLVSMARIYGGLHHVTDVVAGALHGALFGSVAGLCCM